MILKSMRPPIILPQSHLNPPAPEPIPCSERQCPENARVLSHHEISCTHPNLRVILPKPVPAILPHIPWGEGAKTRVSGATCGAPSRWPSSPSPPLCVCTGEGGGRTLAGRIADFVRTRRAGMFLGGQNFGAELRNSANFCCSENPQSEPTPIFSQRWIHLGDKCLVMTVLYIESFLDSSFVSI